MPKKTNFNVNGSSYYRTTATVGKKYDGTPIRKQFYGSCKKEAEKKRDKYLLGIKQGLSIEYDRVTLSVAFNHWLEHVHKQKIKLPSYVKYERMYRLYIATSSIAGMRLADIKAANVQGAYNELLKTTTPGNIRFTHRVLTTFIKYCVGADMLIRSPLTAVVLPKLPTKEKETNTALSDDEVKQLIQAAKGNIKYFPFVFDVFSGLRSGELRALCYKDLDFKTGLINVKKKVEYAKVDGKYKAVVSSVKSKASVRHVPILKEIKGLLQLHIKTVREGLDSVPMDGNFLLFPSRSGGYREGSNFLCFFKRLCKKLGIEEGNTIHSLRHTYCTILARMGVPLLEASRLMGHSNINITAKIYAHVTDEDMIKAVEKLAAYFD